MKNAKKFGMLLVGVILSLMVISFLPVNIKAMIPGVKAIQ